MKGNNHLRFRGYYYDSETKLYYLYPRYYDPQTGRFINADQTENLGLSSGFTGYNLFAYADNDPVNRKDDEGDLGFFASIVVVAGVGAVISGLSSMASQYVDSGTVDWSVIGQEALKGAAVGGIGGMFCWAGGYAAANEHAAAKLGFDFLTAIMWRLLQASPVMVQQMWRHKRLMPQRNFLGMF